jgi:hypothetical protein
MNNLEITVKCRNSFLKLTKWKQID